MGPIHFIELSCVFFLECEMLRKVQRSVLSFWYIYEKNPKDLKGIGTIASRSCHREPTWREVANRLGGCCIIWHCLDRRTKDWLVAAVAAMPNTLMLEAVLGLGPVTCTFFSVKKKDVRQAKAQTSSVHIVWHEILRWQNRRKSAFAEAFDGESGGSMWCVCCWEDWKMVLSPGGNGWLLVSEDQVMSFQWWASLVFANRRDVTWKWEVIMKKGGRAIWGKMHISWMIPQTGLPVGFYLRKKETGHAGGRAVLCCARIWLGALGWVGRGIWPCWARWAGLGVDLAFCVHCTCLLHVYLRCVSFWASQKEPKSKVVATVIWFHWFTCTVWGLCW